MDEWQLEMGEVRHRLSELKANRGDPGIMDELEAQLRILKSFYETAQQVYDQGISDSRLRTAFPSTGFGAWTFENVYSYIYEIAMEIDTGSRELSSMVPEMDYPGLILDSSL
ncbi:MAG: hypothetical protein ACYDGR_15490 [Candidatus Dormibacteria bacterium]